MTFFVSSIVLYGVNTPVFMLLCMNTIAVHLKIMNYEF